MGDPPWVVDFVHAHVSFTRMAIFGSDGRGFVGGLRSSILMLISVPPPIPESVVYYPAISDSTVL